MRQTQECQTASELALWRYNPSKQGVTCDLQATPKHCSSTISMQLLTKKKERKHLVWAHHRKHSGYKKEARQTLRCIDQKAEHTCSRWNLAELGKNIIFLQSCPSVINKQKPSTQHLCSLFLMSAYKYCKNSSDLAHLPRQCAVFLKGQCILYSSEDGFVAVKKSIWFLKLHKHCFIK